MNIPSKELDSGFSLPELSMGTWMIGGAATRDFDCDEDFAVWSIRRGLEAGVRCIDTAEMYADGFTEEHAGQSWGCKLEFAVKRHRETSNAVLQSGESIEPRTSDLSGI